MSHHNARLTHRCGASLLGLALFGVWGVEAARAGAASDRIYTTNTVSYLSGTVFADHNADGRRDVTEPGLAGVLVSNGTDVVATDASGRYTLPVAPRSEVFVIKPPGYELPRGEHNLPLFYRLHWPDGPGEELRYGGVPPTGALPVEHDFPLRSATARDAFSVLVVADPQVHNLTHIEYYERRFIDELSTRDEFAFGVMLGDIVRNDLSLFGPYLPVNARLPGPIFHVVGNHDIDYDATSLTTAVATFTRIFGPANYAFMEGRAVFIVLNNVFTPLPGEAKADGRWSGGLTPAAATFLTNLLRYVPDDRLVVLCQHTPLFPNYDQRSADRARLLDLLRGRRVLALAGDKHEQWHAFLGEESGWRGPEPLRQWVVGTASGSWWGGEPDAHGLPISTMADGTPPGYGILHVDGTDYRLEYRVTGEPADHQFHINAPRHVVAGERDQPMQVNVYNGSARTTVAYRILPAAPERWIPLAQARGIDAAYAGRAWQRSTSATPPAGTYLPPPNESQHLWQGRLARNLPVGTYTMEVRVRDEWGVETLAQHTLEVHPATLSYGRN